MRNWERYSQIPREEEVAQFFERLLESAKSALKEETADDSVDKTKEEEGLANQSQEGRRMSGSGIDDMGDENTSPGGGECRKESNPLEH